MINITMIREGVAAFGKQQMRNIGRKAIAAAGLLWWRAYLPIHFTKRALRRYSYHPRQGDPGSGHPFRGSYAESKIKRRKNGQNVQAIGENKPFVWSGRSREQATSAPNVEAKAKNYSTFDAHVKINAPTLNFVKDASKEIRATAPEEDAALGHEFGENFEVGMKLERIQQKVNF